MLTAKEQKLLDALEPKAAASGVEIVTLEIMGSKKAPTIRVFIDTEEGVSFDELASAQVWINRIMDEIDPSSWEPICSRFLLLESTGPFARRSTSPVCRRAGCGEDVVSYRWTQLVYGHA